MLCFEPRCPRRKSRIPPLDIWRRQDHTGPDGQGFEKNNIVRVVVSSTEVTGRTTQLAEVPEGGVDHAQHGQVLYTYPAIIGCDLFQQTLGHMRCLRGDA